MQAELLKAKSEFDLVIMLRDARNLQAEVELKLQEVNQSVNAIESILIELLEAQNKDKTAVYEGVGSCTKLKPRLYARFDKDNEEQIFQFLRTEKRDDLIKESVHAGSLSSYVKERLGEGKPIPEIIKYIFVPSLRFNAAK